MFIVSFHKMSKPPLLAHNMTHCRDHISNKVYCSENINCLFVLEFGSLRLKKSPCCFPQGGKTLFVHQLHRSTGRLVCFLQLKDLEHLVLRETIDCLFASLEEVAVLFSSEREDCIVS